MGNVKIELNSAGIRELLKSSEIAGVCESQAERLTRATGVPYIPDVYVGKTRVNAAGKTRDSAVVTQKTRSGKSRRPE